MRIVVDGASDAWLYDGTGRADEFDESSGSYTTPGGRFESLTKAGAPAKFTLTKPNGTAYVFDASGTNCKLESITDRAGNSMTFSYDGESRLSTVSDTLGRTITLAYDSNGRITSVTDFDSRVWAYAYTSGDLTSVTSPGVTGFTSGKVTTYGYTSNKLDQITDPKAQSIVGATFTSGKVTTLRYGGSGENFGIAYNSSTQTTVTDRNGNLRVVTISTSGHPTRIVEQTNRGIRSGEGDYTTDYTFNSDGLLTRIDFPAGNAIAYTYDTTPARERSNMLSERLYNDSDMSWRTNDWTYDSAVNLVKAHENTMQDYWSSSASRYTTTYYYDHEEASLGDLNGDSVTTSTDGAIVKIVHPGTTTQTTDVTPIDKFQYNAYGQPTRWDRPGGEVRTYSYHSSGAQAGYLQTQTDDPGSSPHLDIATSWTYDNVGNIATVTNDLGYVTTFTVNDLNQVTNIETPISSSVTFDTKFEYDANDNLTKKEIENLDGDGASVTANPWITTTFTYGNVLNRRTAVTDEIDSTTTVQTTFTYDTNRNLTQITRPEGNVEAFTYDERDLLYQRTRGSSEPVKSIETWTYDGNRNVTTYVTGDGNSWATTYDDWDGRASVMDPAGTLTEFENDDAGRETKREHYGAADKTTLYEDVRTTYCELGKPSQVRRIYKKTPSDSGVNADTNFEYDAASRPWKTYEVRATSPSLVQLITTRTYDAVGRPATVQNDSGDTTTYTYDGAGNVTSIAQLDKAQVGSGSDVTYTTDSTYDRRGQKLSEVRDPGSSPHLAITTTWKRDSRGNVVEQTDPRGNKQNFTYDGRGLRLTVTEDLRSSIRTTSTSSYDDNGNLVQVLDDNGNQTDYAYDALDRRTTRTNDDTTTFTWTYDDDDVVTGWTDENGTVVANTLDAMGRVTHRDITLGTGVEGTDDEDFTYDALGRMTSADNDFSQVDLKWDSLSRCYEESTTWTANSVTRTAKRDFDLTDNVTKLTYPDNTAIDYVIDGDSNRIDQVKEARTSSQTTATSGRAASIGWTISTASSGP
jgi:YD repeat-containing protein